MRSTLTARVQAFVQSEDGGPAAEFALFATILAPLILNFIDMGWYVYQRMQTENVGQAAAQAAWATCTTVPATATACPRLENAVNSALAGSTLAKDGANGVSWTNSPQAISPQKTVWQDMGYYCPDGSNVLVKQSGSTVPCATTKQNPGYYTKISISYPFKPIFPGATIASLLATPLTRDTWIRLD